ncbi:hypothetical protein Dda_9286 [Drechslerella dactyloides]|uniref:Uncharacterized protein n=1 Tax=Drechslerella dactyloides TaxID=74499 RepID=A0AAD6IPR0_DREDA|nr:hypothetical protein Dda_9286 [Drechslerella dactyloides]
MPAKPTRNLASMSQDRRQTTGLHTSSTPRSTRPTPMEPTVLTVANITLPATQNTIFQAPSRAYAQATAYASASAATPSPTGNLVPFAEATPASIGVIVPISVLFMLYFMYKRRTGGRVPGGNLAAMFEA